MKRTIKWFMILAVAAFGLPTGCVLEQTTVETDNRLTMQVSLGSRAVNNDDPNAIEAEKVVHSAYVYIFNAAGVLENPRETSVPIDATTGEAIDAANMLNKVWRVTAGAKKIYVLVNAPAQMLDAAGNTVTMSSFYPFADTEVEELITVAANFASEFNAAQADGMLMSGMLAHTVGAETSTQTVTVAVARRYARLDLSLAKSADMAGNAVVINSVTLRNYSSQTRLIESTPAWDGSATGAAQVQSSLNTTLSTTMTAVGDKMYLMPRPATVSVAGADGSTVPVVDIEATVDSRSTHYYAYLTELGADNRCDLSRPLNIVGNKIYRLNATLSRQSTDITINVYDWKDEPLTVDVEGATLAVSRTAFEMDVENQTADIIYLSNRNVTGHYSAEAALPAVYQPWLTVSGLPDGTACKGTMTLTVDTDQLNGSQAKILLRAGNIGKLVVVGYYSGTGLGVDVLDWNTGQSDSYGGAFDLAVEKQVDIDKAATNGIIELSTDYKGTVTAVLKDNSVTWLSGIAVGAGNANITFSVSANDDFTQLSRSAVIVVTAGDISREVTVTQAGWRI